MKNARVHLRIPQAEKDLWQSTADQYGLDLTALVVRSVRATIANLSSNYSNNATSTTGSSFYLTGASPGLVWTDWNSPTGS